MFMHIAGMGDEAQLGTAVCRVFAKIRETSGGGGAMPKVEIDPSKTSLDPKRIEAILGVRGQLQDGVYKLTVGRTTRLQGHEMGAPMGVNTWAAFAGTDEQAVVDGDFAMLESELQGVLKALRAAGINITAIHQHMVGEEPRILFLHYWAVGRTEDLAKGLRRALDQTGSQHAEAGQASATGLRIADGTARKVVYGSNHLEIPPQLPHAPLHLGRTTIAQPRAKALNRLHEAGILGAPIEHGMKRPALLAREL
jgi:hypothetical protein